MSIMSMQLPRLSFRRIAAIAGVALLAPLPALAHAVLIESAPQAEATLTPGPHPFTLRYNSRIDAARSALTLTGPDHARTRLAVHAGAGPDMLRADADLGKPGHYNLRWQVLAVDGHITRGDIGFTVSAPAAAPTAAPAPASAPAGTP